MQRATSYFSLFPEANVMNLEEQTKIPLQVPITMIKDAIKTLPIEDIRAIKEIIDEVIKEYDEEEEKE